MRQFKTESSRILDLMVNSIYTHKEIFLRELISNASDAIDKLYFRSLTDDGVGLSREDFAIDLAIDRKNRTLTVRDNGCGMTKDELAENLGTIAHSGTLSFRKENELPENEVDVIGQFGVGFYAAFMVAKKVTVTSRAYGENESWRWESSGAEGYTLKPADKAETGTEIVLTLRDNGEEENYDEFLEPYRISGIVKKYSDYIRYPIRMDMEKSRLKEGSDKEWEEYTERVTLNSMVPLWRRNKNEIKPEEYHRFYKDRFYDPADPLKVIHFKAEGAVSFTALLYIPSAPPFNFYTREYEKGLQLYSGGVMIMDKCADLLPDYFSFVHGLVDSSDLSLNISREMLQHDRQLKAIAKSIEKRIKSELSKMMENDRENYEKFWRAFGLQIKFGVYQGYGAKKDFLSDLLMFHSLAENKLVSLSEYIAAMPEGQPYLYYACGESAERISLSPAIERVREKGYDILCMTDDVDEFVAKMLGEMEGKSFKSVADKELGLDSEEEKKRKEEQAGEHRELLVFLKDALSGKVSDVRLSARLKTHPVCLTAEGEISIEMEKVFEAMPGVDNKVKAERVLEINPEHPVFPVLCRLIENDRDKLSLYASLLYDQALLIEGLSLENPAAFADAVCTLMSEKA